MTTTHPHWSSVDGDTATLLDLLATDGTVSAEHEWQLYLAALTEAAVDGIVRPNALRRLVRGRVKPSRIGAFTRRALLDGTLARTGDYEVSDDTGSRNAGRPAPVMRLNASTPAGTRPAGSTEGIIA